MLWHYSKFDILEKTGTWKKRLKKKSSLKKSNQNTNCPYLTLGTELGTIKSSNSLVNKNEKNNHFLKIPLPVTVLDKFLGSSEIHFFFFTPLK